jgi:hypothetical protein
MLSDALKTNAYNRPLAVMINSNIRYVSQAANKLKKYV